MDFKCDSWVTDEIWSMKEAKPMSDETLATLRYRHFRRAAIDHDVDDREIVVNTGKQLKIEMNSLRARRLQIEIN